MQTTFKYFSMAILLFAVLATSCRTEETEFVQESEEDTLAPNSELAAMMQQTVMNDGSNDNIIDFSSCFNIQYPVTVIVNGTELTIYSDDDLDDVEDILDEFDEDDDNVEIQFPITIVFSDFTEMNINSLDEFEDYADDCDENELDDDIECLDFVYPVTASVFNTNNELIETITLTNDYELYVFIDDIDDEDIITFDFPLTLITFDGTELTIANFDELLVAIENYDDSCDEDDDNDYNDDDCDYCTTETFSSVLTDCPSWYVDDLERNDNDYEDLYDGYTFTFDTDGSITVDANGYTYEGTWSASGSGNNIVVQINIPDLPYCNNDWYLHEMETDDDETEIDLRLGDDELEYKSNCN